jgi:ribosomal protein S21
LPELGSNEPHREEILQVYADTLEGLGDATEALDVRIQSFRERPSVESFRRAMDAARTLGRGAEVDRRLIEWAETADALGERLVEIHIHRGDVDAAVRAFRRLHAYHRDELTVRLAEFIANDRSSATLRSPNTCARFDRGIHACRRFRTS